MKNTMLTPIIRPRSRSGVSSCRTMLRMTMLTVSVAPVSARHANVSQNDRETPNPTVARPKQRNRPEQHRTAPDDPRRQRNHRDAGGHGADRRRRVQPAVAARPDLQNVLREDRQQRRRRREERREEIEQHRRSDERLAEDESQAFERRVPRHVVARSAFGRLARRHVAHHQQRDDHEPERRPRWRRTPSRRWSRRSARRRAPGRRPTPSGT